MLCSSDPPNRIKLHQKLLEAQERVVGYLTGRELVYSRLGDWFT